MVEVAEDERNNADEPVTVVIVPVHYGAGVQTYPAESSSVEAETVIQPSIEAAIGYWEGRGLSRPQIVDDQYGRLLVRFERRS